MMFKNGLSESVQKHYQDFRFYTIYSDIYSKVIYIKRK